MCSPPQVKSPSITIYPSFALSTSMSQPLEHCQKKFQNTALAGVAQWIECWPENQRVSGSISSLGHMPGLKPRSPLGGA